MGDLEKALPDEITARAIRSGNELLFRSDDAKKAVHIAGQNHIAVLGVEVLRILDTGFGTETYSVYEFKYDGSWHDYVGLNSDAALRFLEEKIFGNGYGYMLTSTSENEFRGLT